MRRRDALGVIGSAVAWPLAARAQSPKKLPRIGWLTTGPQQRGINAFKEGLAEIGYVEGTNFVLEYRQAESKVERFPALASELVSSKVELIVATNSLAARAVKQATSTIPIVVPIMGDPVGDGLVASLPQPGGNITGLTFLGPELLSKRLALLKEALPAVLRIAALWHPGAYCVRELPNG
jgi:putative ABC transport system substrate-binding protein